MTAAFFLAMAWKSALIAGIALLLAGALKSRSPSDRAAVLRVGVAGLLLLPIVALALPALQIEAWAAPQAAPVAAAAAAAPDLPQVRYVLPAASALQPSGTSIWDDPTPLVLIAYLAGLLMAVGRLAAGVVTLRSWTREARPVTCPEWRAALERARWSAPHGERLRLLLSDAVPSPLSWGWLNPVILIDPDTLDEPENADAILAHEVAHVARWDWPALMLSHLAAALFWFNPLVWKLEREVVQQAEEAADRDAVECVEPTRYAETLLSWAQTTPLVPANSIAPSAGALARRIRAILDGSLRSRPSGSAWTAAAILACIGLTVPVAAVQLVEAKPTPVAPLPPAPPAISVAAAPLPPAVTAPVPPPPPMPAMTAANVTVVGHALQPLPAPPATASPPAPPAPPAAVAPLPPRPPRALVPVESLVAMRIHGVDASYITELAAIGPAYARLSPDEMIAMRIQGVTPGYVREMLGLGYRHLTAEQLTAMRIHGVTARLGRRAIEKEGRLPSAERLVDLAIHGDI